MKQLIYREIQDEAIELLLDYDMSKIPLDIELLLNKMEIERVPYTKYNNRLKELSLKKSEDGYYDFDLNKKQFYIYYNDTKGKNRLKFTFGHELKHIRDLDTERDSNIETEANYFSRFLLVPIPLMIEIGVVEEDEIVEIFEISPQVARYSFDFLKYHGTAFRNYNTLDKELIEMCKDEIIRCKDNLKSYREQKNMTINLDYIDIREVIV